MAHRDAVLAAPAPVSIHGAIAEIDLEARRVAAEMRDNRLAIGGQVVGMDRLGDIAGGVGRIVRLHAEHVAQRLREIDLAALEIGVVDRVIDRLHRERVALFYPARIARDGLLLK